MTNRSGSALALTLALVASVLARPSPSAARKVAARTLAQYRAERRAGARRLATFDDLDFNVYTNQRWNLLKRSHAPNVLVHYPDGHTTRGIPEHVEELKGQFVFMPDTRIRVHPVRVAGGEWTSVIGVLEGTFTKPMPLGGGKFARPTGKRLKLTMCTVGHWTKSGLMDEEYLFWDNATFAKQIGLAK